MLGMAIVYVDLALGEKADLKLEIHFTALQTLVD
jgi:hypothetical protein